MPPHHPGSFRPFRAARIFTDTCSLFQGFICPMCKQEFDQPERLQEHFAQAHDSPTTPGGAAVDISANRSAHA